MCFLSTLNITLILQVAELRKRWLNQNNTFFEVQFLSEDNMNIIPCSIKTLKGLYDISGVEVGQHFYWQIGGFQIHAQVLITSWVVIYRIKIIHDQSHTRSFCKNSVGFVGSFPSWGKYEHFIHIANISCQGTTTIKRAASTILSTTSK